VNLRRIGFIGAALAAVLTSASSSPPPGVDVDGTTISRADTRPGDWLTNGRTYSEQRFSPLDKINKTNVKDLGVAWQYRTYSVRGLEATPIVANGVMFITLPWSKVIALDAKSGKELWT